jgi:sucrose phosphorylase
LNRSDLPAAIQAHLAALYGDSAGQAAYSRLTRLLDKYRHRLALSPGGTPAGSGVRRPANLTELDAILITYGDQVREPGVPPLQTLARFCEKQLAGLVSGVHVLPFFPYSSDDGFAVIDYRKVDAALGTWEDVARLGASFRLMFDAVINHVSAESEWFRAFLRDDPAYRDYFIVVPEGADLSRVVRPRALPLVTRVMTPSGEKAVWTTFSDDQIDLNYSNPAVLLEIIDTLLFYVARGAEFLRLDAIAYLWKEIGTTCIHLPHTHHVVQLLRAVLDAVAPHVALVTETNVPHAENVSYFGDGTNEAQLVYNFALPPLVLHAFQTEDARHLAAWAAGLSLPSGQVTFFNFLASHDGIGLNPVRGILSEEEIEAMVERTRTRGGLVSYKRNPDGTQSPYEVNVNYFDALAQGGVEEDIESGVSVGRFVAAQAIMLSLVGVPGIYFHSLFGSRGWPEGVEQTGRQRTINRQKCDLTSLEVALADPDSLRSRIFRGYVQLLKARAATPAFHPHGAQQVIRAAGGPPVFALLRTAPGGGDRVVCLHNVSGRVQPVQLDLPASQLGMVTRLTDLIGGARLRPAGTTFKINLAPYQVSWLKVEI